VKEKAMNTSTEKKTRRVRRSYRASEKAAAVLAVWGGRRRAGRVCRELGINWGILNGWEKRAIQGIRASLAPAGERPAEAAGVTLGKRLEGLLGQTEVPEAAAIGTETVAETERKE
jgi:transposase-like protein